MSDRKHREKTFFTLCEWRPSLNGFGDIPLAVILTVEIDCPASIAPPAKYAGTHEVEKVALEGLFAHLLIEYLRKITHPRLAVFANECDDALLTAGERVQLRCALRYFGTPECRFLRTGNARGCAKRRNIFSDRSIALEHALGVLIAHEGTVAGESDEFLGRRGGGEHCINAVLLRRQSADGPDHRGGIAAHLFA